MANQSVSEAMNKTTHGVYVIGVHTAEQDDLATEAWMCQFSGSPAMVAVAVSSGHLTAELVRKAGKFTVSILKDSQKDEAIACGSVSGRKEDKTKKVDCAYTKSGIPYLKNSIAVLTCKVADINDRFNHVMFFAEVEDAVMLSPDANPLEYHAKEFFG